MTSCFVYKVMGLTCHERINTQLIYRIAVAQVVTRRIISFFFFFGGGGGGGRGGWRSDFIILFMSYLFFFLFILIIIFFYPFNMYKVHIMKTSVATQATVNYEIHANVSVKRHICDVKICD